MTGAGKNSQGFLVVLSDVEHKDERDHLNWLTTEHAQERLGIPGFLGVRIFRRPVASGYRYFIWYRLANADVVDSAAYLERLNNPTPWSQRIMPILGNFGRGGGTVADSSGEAGEFLLALELENPPQGADYTMAVAAKSGFRAGHLLVTDHAKSAVRTSERALRKSDNSFAALLLLESDSLKTPEDAAAALSPAAALRADSLFSGSYRAIFSLQN